MIQIKRVYEPYSKGDGYRVLVDRLWPRGIKKENLKLNDWFKDLAPSNELRKEFGHDPKKWKTFISQYKKELKQEVPQALLEQLSQKAKKGTVTLLYAAKDELHNNAVVLQMILKKGM